MGINNHTQIGKKIGAGKAQKTPGERKIKWERLFHRK